ncbi:MAG: phosphoribosyltransferase [Halobacteria archaeon]
MEYLRLTWEDIERHCEVLYRRIKQRGFKPEVIVGIARGGWVPARILSDLLDIDELFTMRIKFYTSIDERAKKPMIVYPLPLNLRGRRVLLVDDIADTGESLELAQSHLRENQAGEILTVTIVKKPRSKVIPDLYGVETSAWVVFPWEISETIKHIIKRGGNEGEILLELERAGVKDSYMRRMEGG